MDNIILNVWLFILIPLLMGGACISMADSKKDNRNKGAGYRTKGSLQSQENWNIANRTFGYCSFGIIIVDILAILLEYKVFIPKEILPRSQVFFLNLFVMFAGIFLCVVITEVRLRRKK